jgi:SAM-dependent methyltransferase
MLIQYREQNWRGIQTPAWQQRIVDETMCDEGGAVLRQVAPHFQLPADAKVLDVGSGVGSFVVACRRRGVRAFGIEPDRIGKGAGLTAIQIARSRLRTQAFVAGVGERLPFPDSSFDLVVMNQVVEHVSDQRGVLQEAARVVKVGGAIYVACPNYLRFYEPHYKLRWFPLLPKLLGNWYLRLRRRDPVLLQQLTYTTNARLRTLLNHLGPEYAVLDLHREDFLRKCRDSSFVSRRARLVRKITQLPLVGGLVVSAVLFYLRICEGGCEMLILRKQKPEAE